MEFLETVTLHKWQYWCHCSCLVKVFFLLVSVDFVFYPSLPRKFTTFFPLFFLCQVELFHPNFTAQAHMSLLSSCCIFFKIPHNKNVSLILILLLRQSKPSLFGMSYRSQRRGDSLMQRFYLKHLLCGRRRLKTDQVVLRAVLEEWEWEMLLLGR